MQITASLGAEADFCFHQKQQQFVGSFYSLALKSTLFFIGRSRMIVSRTVTFSRLSFSKKFLYENVTL